MKCSKVSVIMSAYNAAATVGEAIESILAQTYADFEFIIINDGSTDASSEIIEECKNKDDRIKFINSPRNYGLTWWLYNAVDMAKGEYIARQDADDYSLPDRIEKQLALIETGVDIVSSYVYLVTPKRERLEILFTPPLTHTATIKRLRQENCIIHSTVMFRKSSVGNYDLNYKYAQDYELYLRAIKNGLTFAAVLKPLIEMRQLPSSISRKHRKEQMRYARRAQIRYFGWWRVSELMLKMIPGVRKIFEMPLFINIRKMRWPHGNTYMYYPNWEQYLWEIIEKIIIDILAISYFPYGKLRMYLEKKRIKDKTDTSKVITHFSTTAKVWRDKIYKPLKTQRWYEYFDKQYRFNYTVDMIPKTSKGTALDVGCGAGQLLPILINLGYKTYGIDVSESMVAIASKTKKSFVKVCNCENTGYPDNYFDVYVAMGVIEYTNYNAPMLTEMKRILKPGGIAIITVRNADCKITRLRRTLSIVSRKHKPRELRKELEDMGFTFTGQRYAHFRVGAIGKLCEKLFSKVTHTVFASTYIIKVRK